MYTHINPYHVMCVCETDATKDFAYIAIHNGMSSICKWVYDGIMRDPPYFSLLWLRVLWHPATSINIHAKAIIHPIHPSFDIQLSGFSCFCSKPSTKLFVTNATFMFCG